MYRGRPRARQRLVRERLGASSKDIRAGLERALERKPRPLPPGLKRLDGEQEAQVIALRLGAPPKGYANWSLRLLARRVVELAIVESVSHETIRRTLKTTG